MKLQLIDSNGVLTEVMYNAQPLYTGNLVITFKDNELKIKNNGNPDNWNAYTYTPQPFFFTSVKILGVPIGYSPSLYPFDGSKIVYSDGVINDWLIVDPNGYKHAHKRYPESTTYHHIDGGDTFYLRFIPYGNFSNPIPQNETAVLNILNLDFSLLTNPRVSRILSFYDFNLESLSYNSLNRNFGWRMVPANFTTRYTSISKDFVSGWYGFGATHSAGEGFTNEHYDHVLWWFLSAMLNGNTAAYDIGIELLNHKIAYGFIDCNSNITWKHWWRGEKGNRRGELMPPASAKEWDTGLIVGALLTGNQWYKDTCLKRINSLLFRANTIIWNGAGGGRMLGNYLSCVLAYYKFDELLGFNLKPQIEAKINSVLDHTFNIIKTNNYFPNLYLTSTYPVWEESTAYVGVYKWSKILNRDLTKITAMIDWLINVGSGYYDATHYGVADHIMTATNQKIFTTPNTAAWWVPLWKIAEEIWPTVYTEKAASATDTCYNNIGLTWNDITSLKSPLPPDKLNVDLGAYGASAEKQWPYLLTPLINL